MTQEPVQRKVVNWLGASREVVRNWSKSVREEAGSELLSVQEGRDPSNWKPLSIIGPGVREIRIAEDGEQYRVIYVAKFEEAVYVLHAFEKKTQKTPKRDLDLATKRYKDLLVNRRKATE